MDSQVQGLRFEATTTDGTTSGSTNEKGGFNVPNGAVMTFFVGDVELGTAPAATLLTPVSLVPGAGDENHPTVSNIARLLQSLDSNAFPLDGISISSAVSSAATGLTLDVSQAPANFAADPAVATLLTAAGATNLVSVAEAASHLRIFLLGSFGGLYEGTFAGGDSGTFKVVIDRAGRMLGAAVAASDLTDVIGVTGTLTTAGTGVFGNASSGATFNGEVAAGALTGTWNNTFFGESGTFSGNTDASTEPFVDDVLTFVRAYTGTFDIGEDSSVFSAVVDARGHIEITEQGGSEVIALVESVQGSTARIVGITDLGTVMDGTISQSGAMSGTLTNAFFGETGTFSGNAQ